MVELRGKRTEIAKAVKCIAPEWPVQLIEQLDPGEWHFTLNGVDVLVQITDAECVVCKKKADCPWTMPEVGSCSAFEPNWGDTKYHEIVFRGWEDD